MVLRMLGLGETGMEMGISRLWWKLRIMKKRVEKGRNGAVVGASGGRIEGSSR